MLSIACYPHKGVGTAPPFPPRPSSARRLARVRLCPLEKETSLPSPVDCTGAAADGSSVSVPSRGWLFRGKEAGKRGCFARSALGGGPGWRHALGTLVLGAVSLAAICLLLGKTLVASAGWTGLARSQVSCACLLLGGSGGLLCVVISAYQWRALLLAQGRQLDLAELIRLYLIGLAFSHCLPLGIGGDAIKALYSGRALGSYPLAAATLALARLLGLLALSLLLGGALCIWRQLLPAPLPALAAAVSLLIMLALACLFVLGRLASRRQRSGWPAQAGDLPRLLCGKKLGLGLAALTTVVAKPFSFLPSLGFSLCFWVMAGLNYYSYGLALDIHLPLPCYLVAIPLVALAAALPLSLFNGLGIREGSLVAILALYHVPASKALFLAACVDAQGVLLALGGWLVYLLRRREEK
ncbi:lysylphosphatidylglycerol synthase transmembrane domain-containing protein [Thermogemmatispora carboxidivorans]|uniref:lysylphosphatidylglycerol synthase transmembrane domain-containing protein n=1 Tax=Thermogemmatispora carboxidivorans TaxID=1382306 RepID=UPI001EE20F21|nr:lysylphosphatidylglycerol synthase transmembrane domain-containing protein [Thermogemmatispora carboxidivorans]